MTTKTKKKPAAKHTAKRTAKRPASPAKSKPRTTAPKLAPPRIVAPAPIATKQPTLPGVPAPVRVGAPHGAAKKGLGYLQRVQVMLEPHEVTLLETFRTKLSPHAPLSQSGCARAILLAGFKALATVTS